MKKQFIFLGPPASGKGTQTKKLTADLNLPHIDTGSMLRGAAKEGTQAGLVAKSFMDKGNLVPVEIVVKIIKDRLTKDDCKNGFVLDGFPRSMEQALAFDEILEDLNKDSDVKVMVLNIQVPFEKLVERIINRRSCKNCGKIYNLKFASPKVDDICDVCSGRLIQRADDTREIANKRIETYNKETQPLIKFYEDKGLLFNVNGDNSINEIYADIKEIIK